MSKSLRLLLLALVTSSLPACTDKQAWTRGEIEDIADNSAQGAVAPAEIRIRQLEIRLEAMEKLAKANQNYTRAVANQVDANSLAEMTRRGECGYQARTGPSGGTVYTPIQCTKADLAN